MATTPPKRAAKSVSKATTTRPPTSSSAKPTSATAAAGSAVVGQAGQVAVRPPLEKALDAFTRELRAALDRSAAESAALRAELSTLRAEVDDLRQRHAAHTHTYTSTQMGGGGHQWIELRFLQGYIDGEKPGYTNYGIWARGKSTSDVPADRPTSGPSV